jgi:hypothetical protein
LTEILILTLSLTVTLTVTLRCLNPDPLLRPSLIELRSLSLFGLLDDQSAIFKAERESGVLTALYSDAKTFFSENLLDPFKEDLLSLMKTSEEEGEEEEGGEKETKIDSYSGLERVSSYMGCIEELVAIGVKQSNNKGVSAGTEILGPFLGTFGVGSSWLHSKAVEILG